MALPFWRIGLVASSGSFSKRTHGCDGFSRASQRRDLMTAASNKRFIFSRLLQACHNRSDDGLADGTASR